jgi:uncharacterized membrane protein
MSEQTPRKMDVVKLVGGLYDAVVGMTVTSGVIYFITKSTNTFIFFLAGLTLLCIVNYMAYREAKREEKQHENKFPK